MSENGTEPIRGLPEELPSGERIVWQGEPRWWTLARRAFHIRSVALYFAVMVLLRGAFVAAGGGSTGDVVGSVLGVTPLALVALGILAGLAWLNARTTVYTITTRRVVMRYGVAIPMTVNIPFRIIESASVKVLPDGDGDLPLRLSGPDRLAYAHLWPHARPWRFSRPEPMLRAVPDAREVARQLADAITAAQGGATQAPAEAESETPRAERAARAGLSSLTAAPGGSR